MNTSIIPVFTAVVANEPAQLCNARELHAVLQVGRDFSNWIKDRIETYGFVEGEDFVIAQTLSSPNPASAKSRAQKRTDYHLTLDMAKELAIVENNEVGRQIRRYFIQLEKKAIAAGLRVDSIISRAKVGELSALMAERFPAGKDRPYAWSRFNNHFRLASYRDLPADKFEAACAYIQQMPVKAKALTEANQPGIEGEYMPAANDPQTLNDTIARMTQQVESGNGTPVDVFLPLVMAVVKKQPELLSEFVTEEQLTRAAIKQLQTTRFTVQFGASDYFGSEASPIMVPIAKGAQTFKPQDVINEIASNRTGFFKDGHVKEIICAIGTRLKAAA